MQPNKRDNPYKQNNGLRTLADFFSSLLEKKWVAHGSQDR
jgi:hypothetical protein